jgi:hypothetical protein
VRGFSKRIEQFIDNNRAELTKNLSLAVEYAKKPLGKADWDAGEVTARSQIGAAVAVKTASNGDRIEYRLFVEECSGVGFRFQEIADPSSLFSNTPANCGFQSDRAPDDWYSLKLLKFTPGSGRRELVSSIAVSKIDDEVSVNFRSQKKHAALLGMLDLFAKYGDRIRVKPLP